MFYNDFRRIKGEKIFNNIFMHLVYDNKCGYFHSVFEIAKHEYQHKNMNKKLPIILTHVLRQFLPSLFLRYVNEEEK